MTSIFVSHASQDDADVDRVVAALRSWGHDVWVDRSDLSAGSALALSIQEGLSNAEVFLLLHSAASSRSQWVELEWQAALAKSISDPDFTFLLAALDPTPPPLLLQSKKWLKLRSGGDLDLEPLREALGGRPDPATSRPSLWYYDDERAWLDRFTREHEDRFEIRTFDNASELLSALQMTALGNQELPDVVLMDYYAYRNDLTPEQRERAREAVTVLLDAEHRLKGVVDAAWHPAGVDIVETVRDFYPPEKLPIAMHTQQGLILLRDDHIQQLETLGVEWLIKNRFSAETDRLVLAGIAQRAGHTITRSRPLALIVDDNPNYIRKFRERQQDFYDIESITSEAEVMPTLARMEAEGRFPDFFLVDMYYPTGPSESQELIDAANRKLKEFADLESATQDVVRQSFEPLGLRMIRKIRKFFPPSQLPVLVYTVSGLVSVGDQGFREIERLGGTWLLKDRYDAQTEEILICGEIFRARRGA
ncbi:toll/interleukin-1 receptor domain-containing protein [Actinomyces polynesiensis]|uniref:toll/interleukin-1 receptor domain-containing protein n=1 Tax=Actinomyces polynesiensis TaxID=1325934 RepID=UPI0005B81FB2|nr:toll/interleukin-1 receptor domain-containing protein [Actinomyces polynesiensis]